MNSSRKKWSLSKTERRQEKVPLFSTQEKIKEEQNTVNSNLFKRKRTRSETNLIIEEDTNSALFDFAKLHIFVKFFSEEMSTFIVEKCQSILDLKQQIEAQEGILLEKQNLFFNGEKLENEKTFDFYNIRTESTLYLLNSVIEEPVQIFVNHCGKIFTLNIAASDPIQKIRHQIQERTQIPLEYQILKHAGRILDCKMPASFYNIEKESTIFLSTRSFSRKFLFFKSR